MSRRTHTGPAQPAVGSGGVALIAKPGGANTGVGRYVRTLQRGLIEAGAGVVRIAPVVPPLPDASYRALRRMGWDLRTFLMNYPVWAQYPAADVYHLTSQNLASLLLFRRPPGKVVVTVHDIIPYMLRHNRQLCAYHSIVDRLFDRMAMAGLRRADRLIADSHYTRQCVTGQLGIAAEKIEVVYLGIDHTRFRPQPVPTSIRERYRLPAGRRYLIYVGSDDPRKNLVTLVRALAAVRSELPDVEFVKVGRAHFDQERRRSIDVAKELGVDSAIHFLDDIPEADLPLLYCLADVCVMPSLYEGFGFPVLEALACGTPVIALRATSIPEIAGDAALLLDDPTPDDLAAAITRTLAGCAPERGTRVRQAARFSWGATVAATRGVYAAVLGQKEAA